eukprot:COSAG02_NODE_34402_length_484_cov_1.623377_1_plen_50_part_01
MRLPAATLTALVLIVSDVCVLCSSFTRLCDGGSSVGERANSNSRSKMMKA